MSKTDDIELVRAERDAALALLAEARLLGCRMSGALGSDECTIPWDDDLLPRIDAMLAG